MTDKETIKYIIGIDEVGRGPIAGPVTVCAFLLKDESFLEFAIGKAYGKDGLKDIGQTYVKLPKLRDSKKLSKKQREIWYEFLKSEKEKGNCDFAVSFVSSENIDKFGIAKCIQKALDNSLLNLLKTSSLETSYYKLMLDGGLHAPKEFINQETIIKGDELHPVISLASIVAKVSRDKVMETFSKKYPEYGFDKHMGYGTKAHYDAIKKYGQTPIHRKSFIH
ncbi:MAG: Ribonuclease HII [Parcubacteria bacterium RAAC4_OD1_1]|nr:MAG: Ribonuclease HII [Parcubacteria bacterium RAAC4_OD1_1]